MVTCIKSPGEIFMCNDEYWHETKYVVWIITFYGRWRHFFDASARSSSSDKKLL